ncbi:major capsid protein [Gracilimonas sediminicola]|uniref:Major capsid protein n=1 Tax=Gracilimonas sediminicola TaxID=2952158 RepID=A0A9X2L0B7_9BACT|nr:major capsid protein [Gracilimonas sediminicola]MCP9289996.1 major capsid protein [Gracilimonas sediminicola]
MSGTYADFKIYPDQVHAGMNEFIQQNVDVFNGASSNAIRLVPLESRGHFREESFFKEIQNLIKRNDPATLGSSNDDKLTQDDVVSPKISWKFQVKNTIDSFLRIASNEQEFSFLLGEQVAAGKMQYMLERGIIAAVTCLGLSSNNYVTSTGATMDYDKLVDGNAKFGDRASRIVAYVGHSKQWHDLQKASFDVQVENVAGTGINAGTIPSLGKAMIMTDSANLKDTDGASTSPDVASYKMLGLVENGIVISEVGQDRVVDDVITGDGPLSLRIQGEGNFLVTIKGFQYDEDPVNPNDGALGTAGNWSQVATDTKNTAGFYVETR